MPKNLFKPVKKSFFGRQCKTMLRYREFLKERKNIEEKFNILPPQKLNIPEEIDQIDSDRFGFGFFDQDFEILITNQFAELTQGLPCSPRSAVIVGFTGFRGPIFEIQEDSDSEIEVYPCSRKNRPLQAQEWEDPGYWADTESDCESESDWGFDNWLWALRLSRQLKGGRRRTVSTLSSDSEPCPSLEGTPEFDLDSEPSGAPDLVSLGSEDSLFNAPDLVSLDSDDSIFHDPLGDWQEGRRQA